MTGGVRPEFLTAAAVLLNKEESEGGFSIYAFA
jgi:hypothetical protein